MDDLIVEFLTETNESLEVVDSELVKFEANPNERKTLDNIFRIVHTVKGTCGFLGLRRLEAVAHTGETLLGRFRDGKLEVTPGAVTAVLQSIDRIKDILSGLEATGTEPSGDDSELIARLEAISEGEPATPAADLNRLLHPGELSFDELEAAFQTAEDPDWMYAASVETTHKAIAAVAQALKSKEAKITVADLAASAGNETVIGGNQSVRVSVEVLEGLMTLMSEMVRTRNQLLHINSKREDDEFATLLARLSSLIDELQDNVMKTRMQPIGAAWKKLPRLVRDLSQKLEKQIDLVMEGEATELDRQVLELIRDPLTHMVRNCADHGIEGPEERTRAGKPLKGTIRLSAFHNGGGIVIQISDNGRGLNTPRIREKLIEKGLASRTEVETMTDQQVHRYIFAPGFSTAQAVTNLSGRGVGMDVVRTNIEQIGGQIDLMSVTGQGASFTIKIPQTLDIVSALIVGSGGQRFAVPQTSVLELVRTGPNAKHRIERMDQNMVLCLRDKLLPLVHLNQALNLDTENDELPSFVVVIQVGEQRYGLLVKDVLDTEEIVVKPLATILHGVEVFSGATILGDGSVVLILDPNSLAEQAGQLLEVKTSKATEGVVEQDHAEKTTMLLFRSGSSAIKAVALAHVTRLEHIEIDKIVQLNGRRAIQYRGRLIPVLSLDYGASLTEGAVQPMLVFTFEGYPTGLAVDEIVDVIEDHLKIEPTADRAGVRGTAVVGGRACEILDVEYYHLNGLAEHVRNERVRLLHAEEGLVA